MEENQLTNIRMKEVKKSFCWILPTLYHLSSSRCGCSVDDDDHLKPDSAGFINSSA